MTPLARRAAAVPATPTAGTASGAPESRHPTARTAGPQAPDAGGPPRDPDAPAWPPLVRVPGGDRAALLRRIVGG